MSDDPKILGFPKAEEVPPEERARRLRVEVERLASFSASEWLYYVECTGVAEKHGVSRDILREMIETTIKANEKKAREDKAEDRQRVQRVEKEQRSTAAEDESGRAEQERADKEAARKQKEKDRAFAAIIKLPKSEHEAKLKTLARQLGEDVEVLRDEFVELRGEEEEKIKRGEVEPWDEPVDTRELLDGVTTQFGRYIIVHDRVIAPIIPLWICFAWCPRHRDLLTDPGIRERRHRRGQDRCKQSGRPADAPCVYDRRADGSGVLSFR